MSGHVVAVSRSVTHSMSKPNEDQIELRVGLGVEGDAHLGRTVQHLSRIAKNPDKPNLRQIHLIAAELHDELRERGFHLRPGQMGENITTRGVDLLGLPAGTILRFGSAAAIEVTGLRNPCHQLNGIHPGLMEATLDYTEDGELIRRAGIMAVVRTGGPVGPGDVIEIELPSGPHRSLEPV